jgi:hypothetical protein
MVWANKNQYTGGFDNDIMNGNGSIKYNDGGSYKG